MYVGHNWEIFKTWLADSYRIKGWCYSICYATWLTLDIFFCRNIIPSKWNIRKNVPSSIIFHLIWINLGCKIIYSLRRIHYCREIRARLLLQIILHFCLGWLIWLKMSGQRLVFDPKSLPMVINVSVGLIKDHMNIDLTFNSE